MTPSTLFSLLNILLVGCSPRPPDCRRYRP